VLKGETPNPIDLPSGCRFHPRWPEVEPDCRKLVPVLAEAEPERFMACGVVRRRMGGDFRGRVNGGDHQQPAVLGRRGWYSSGRELLTQIFPCELESSLRILPAEVDQRERPGILPILRRRSS
jgi:hypothetical protein